jgi:hypothetical protein
VCSRTNWTDKWKPFWSTLIIVSITYIQDTVHISTIFYLPWYCSCSTCVFAEQFWQEIHDNLKTHIRTTDWTISHHHAMPTESLLRCDITISLRISTKNAPFNISFISTHAPQSVIHRYVTIAWARRCLTVLCFSQVGHTQNLASNSSTIFLRPAPAFLRSTDSETELPAHESFHHHQRCDSMNF